MYYIHLDYQIALEIERSSEKTNKLSASTNSILLAISVFLAADEGNPVATKCWCVFSPCMGKLRVVLVLAFWGSYHHSSF